MVNLNKKLFAFNPLLNAVGNQMRIRRAGGLEAVINVMNTNIDRPVLCLHGCGIIFHFTETIGKYKISPVIDNNLHVAGQEDVRNAGGISTVIRAMNIHINDTDVCKHGCRALEGLLENNRK